MGSRAVLAQKWLFLALICSFWKLRSATCDTRSRPSPLSFWLILCVVVPHTHRYHPPNFQRNPKHHNGCLNFPHFARAACCLLLAANPGRSTLDTKKGYKTKTGSTSSVTLTLTLTLTPPPPHPWPDAPLTPGQTPSRPTAGTPPPPTPGRPTPTPDCPPPPEF